jgi:hypothetical protein
VEDVIRQEEKARNHAALAYVRPQLTAIGDQIQTTNLIHMKEINSRGWNPERL